MQMVVHMTHPDWRQDSQKRVWLRGVPIYSNAPLNAEAFARAVVDSSKHDQWRDFVSQLAGFFAFVALTPQGVAIGVDRVRSIPLFYAENGDTLYLSDSAEWLRQRLQIRTLNPDTRQEFLLTGFVSGDRTLLEGVRQAQAGEVIFIETTSAKRSVTPLRYYLFRSLPPASMSETEFNDALSRVVFECIERLIRFAAGRPLAVPLSGGADSRLIVTALRYLNYTPLLAFSYGAAGSRDPKRSLQVAQALEIPWRYVEYTRPLWDAYWDTEARRRYYLWASNWSSLPHPQDWIAVQELKRAGFLPNEAVLVPGHSADFVAGSHIPVAFFEPRTFTTEEVIAAIWDKHCSPPYRPSTRARYMERIQTALCLHGELSQQEAVDAFELWDWQERQAKYIVNSVRLYEFWDYAWWLPLWDNPFVEFWQRVPLEQRFGRRRYLEFVGYFTRAYGNEALAQVPLVVPASRRGGAPSFLRRAFYIWRRMSYLPEAGNLYALWQIAWGRQINSFYTYEFLRGAEQTLRRSAKPLDSSSARLPL
ncbi:MAG: asparagine synthetase B family protein [Fimbriimonadales bacterium]|nr:asparagine synthetase B family protein [Fimbriimonadales bacterium]